MRYGYWLPVFGGWLRNVPDEGMEASWRYVQRLAAASEQIGYDLTLVAELFLNDIKGIEAPSLDAWSTAAALAAVTERPRADGGRAPDLPPAGDPRQAGGEHRPHQRRPPVAQRGVELVGRRGAPLRRALRRARRPLRPHRGVARGARRRVARAGVPFKGRLYEVDQTVLEPKPLRRPRPTIYAGGESEAAKRLISARCDAFVMHGDPPDRVAPKVDDMRRRRDAAARERTGRDDGLPPLQFGVAAYAIVRDTEAEARREVARITNVAPGTPGYRNYQDWVSHTQLEQQVSLEDYSVSNRGLRAGLVGTPEQVADRVRAFSDAGVDLLLLQCSPQLEEMERFAEQVMPLVGAAAPRLAA
jgi:FMNH2-dependent dimethyl sulfone monooxygenase